MHGQSNLWWHINESFTQKQTHRLSIIFQELIQLLNYMLFTALLTPTQNQLFDLLSTLCTLESKGMLPLHYTTIIYTGKSSK